MPKIFNFNKIKYRRPYIKAGERWINEIIGLDAETDRNGKPFLFALSDKTVFEVSDIPHLFFRRQFRSKNFGVWNLKFDSGCILSNLPRANRSQLRQEGKTSLEGFTYKYIPHKLLRISKGKHAVSIWDIYPFYKMSLEKAASRYLNKHKKDINPEKFSDSFIRKHRTEIEKYCIQDAVLVSNLYDHLLDGFQEIDLKPNNLYSVASITFQYFKQNTKIIDVWRYWQHDRDLLRYACESYAGGKFEVYKRGTFEGVSYDINSAYPYEMCNLYDISKAIVKQNNRYEPEATYGFLRVLIDNSKARFISVAVKSGNLNLYPAGIFYSTITKQEYDYLITIGVKVKIISCYWLFIQKKRKVYAEICGRLYKKKQEYKDIDERQYMIYKILLNSFYGKMVQLIEKNDGALQAGVGWNPIFGSIITANVRLKVSQVCQDNPNNVLAVHTDSVIMDKPLSRSYQGKALGKWSKDNEGKGVIVSCGVYQLGDKNRYRGFIMPKGFTWENTLKKMGKASKKTFTQRQAKSWVHSNFLNRDDETNVFEEVDKILDLNSDSKRIWLKDTTGTKLINGIEESIPHFLVSNRKLPWRLKSGRGHNK